MRCGFFLLSQRQDTANVRIKDRTRPPPNPAASAPFALNAHPLLSPGYSLSPWPSSHVTSSGRFFPDPPAELELPLLGSTPKHSILHWTDLLAHLPWQN